MFYRDIGFGYRVGPHKIHRKTPLLFFLLFFLYSFRLPACSFMEKEAPEEEFSCKFFEAFKNSFLVEQLQPAPSLNSVFRAFDRTSRNFNNNH